MWTPNDVIKMRQNISLIEVDPIINENDLINYISQIKNTSRHSERDIKSFILSHNIDPDLSTKLLNYYNIDKYNDEHDHEILRGIIGIIVFLVSWPILLIFLLFSASNSPLAIQLRKYFRNNNDLIPFKSFIYWSIFLIIFGIIFYLGFRELLNILNINFLI